jgi:hypothetical protein
VTHQIEKAKASTLSPKILFDAYPLATGVRRRWLNYGSRPLPAMAAGLDILVPLQINQEVIILQNAASSILV